MKEHIFAFIDTETTGLNPEKHELIQVACILVSASNPEDISTYEVVKEFECKIQPTHIHDADPTALKINKYDPSVWVDAKSLHEAMTVLSGLTKGAVMVGHNVTFDWTFLDKAFRQTGVENKMHYHKLDTISMAFALLHGKEDAEHLSLHALSRYFNITQDKEHEALSDARSTFELYKKLMSL